MGEFELQKIAKLEAENKRLKDKVDWATGYTANTLIEHNVSGFFITGYIKTFGDTDEWVNIAYVKEIFEILAKPCTSLSEKGTTQK